MGNLMGSYPARSLDLYMDDKPTFNEQAGFSFERKPRGSISYLTQVSQMYKEIHNVFIYKLNF